MYPLDFSHLLLYDKLHCLRLLVDRLIKMFHRKIYSLNFLKVFHDQYVLKSKILYELNLKKKHVSVLTKPTHISIEVFPVSHFLILLCTHRLLLSICVVC